MDIATIAAAYEGLKTCKEIFRAFIDTKVDAEVKPEILAALEKLGNAQDTLFSLRDELFKLQATNEELRKELAISQSWEEISSKYQLTKTSGGAVVYESNSGLNHYICPSCYNLKQIQILQDNRSNSGKFRCTGCNSEYPIELKKTNTQRHIESPKHWMGK